jgi:hypothetical protein
MAPNPLRRKIFELKSHKNFCARKGKELRAVFTLDFYVLKSFDEIGKPFILTTIFFRSIAGLQKTSLVEFHMKLFVNPLFLNPIIIYGRI